MAAAAAEPSQTPHAEPPANVLIDSPSPSFSPRRTDSRSHRLLTLIPEGYNTIHHRVKIVLAGTGARALAEKVVNSPLNMVPRSRTPAGVLPFDVNSSFNSVGTPISASSSLTMVSKSSSASSKEKSCRSSSEEDNNAELDRGLCLFCRVGEAENKLARIRIGIVEGFTSSMPDVPSEHVARDMCVALLHWHDHKCDVGTGPGSGRGGRKDGSKDGSKESSASTKTTQDSIGKSLKDFSMRAAEMSFSMKYLPLVFLLCISGTADAAVRFRDFMEHCEEQHNIRIALINVESDGDAPLLHAMKACSEAVIDQRDRPLGLRYTSCSSDASRSSEGTKKKSMCCNVA